MTKSNEEWLSGFKDKHGEKYEYLDEVINGTTKINISCNIHGIFTMTPKNHLKGQNCPTCSKELLSTIRRYSYEEWVKKFNSVHNFKYTYPKQEIKSTSVLQVFCKDHGLFSINTSNHSVGKGCSKCGVIKMAKNQTKNIEQLLVDFNNTHGDYYDYSKVHIKYVNAKVKVDIICPIHGSFLQTPNCHLSGRGCNKCAKSNHSGSWSYSAWKECAERSNNFDSFKTYIVRFDYDFESFIKIGKTFQTISERFSGSRSAGYVVTVIKVFTFNNSIDCSVFEKELQNKYKKYKYKPLREFGGMHECYSIDIEEYINKEYENE